MGLLQFALSSFADTRRFRTALQKFILIFRAIVLMVRSISDDRCTGSFQQPTVSVTGRKTASLFSLFIRKVY